ncbi:MAG TPA: iron uptake transporter permease EfeU [Acidimicrobiales bacterium]|nr:iron uptake transporter permease EfeU [Acidimicrobiales bacterium]
MSWSDAVPNLLIGLREGLEAGLVVSILLAALHKTTPSGQKPSTTPIWLGVVGAVAISGSFAAVLTYSTDVLSSSTQQAVGGILSVLAVVLVTGMVFWMRRTASTLAGQLRGEVQRAALIGGGALAVTAFLAVGREGLETTLFLWTAVRASGETVAPLVGAAIGLAAAVILCWLLFRRAIKLNLGVFFSRTAIVLIVIAAGILAYGLGDLQDAGLLPGAQWVAFDLTGHVDPNSWWVSLITGATELTAKMTVLQVVAWATYLAVVIPLFVRAGRTVAAAPVPVPAAGPSPGPGHADRWARLAGGRPWLAAAVLIAVPVAAAGAVIAVLPSSSGSGTTDVTVTDRACGKGWTGGRTGTQTFAVANKSGKAGEVILANSAGAIVAEIETIGPATTATMTADLGAGSYSFQCRLSGQAMVSSAPVQVAGSTGRSTTVAAVLPVSVKDLTGPNDAYRQYAAADLATLATDVARIRADLVAGALPAARADWLTAQLDWERVGASYDSFGDLGVAIDGLPDGLQGGVDDPRFTGLHRLEYGLWHGQGPTELLAVTDTLQADITKLQGKLASTAVAGDPTNLPIRAHEILEDALRDHLSGIDDLGAGAAYPETSADLQVTRVVLGELAPLIDARAPKLLPTARTQMDALQSALQATQVDGQWRAPSATPLAARQQVDAAVGALLETLSSVPDLLEVPPSHG